MPDSRAVAEHAARKVVDTLLAVEAPTARDVTRIKRAVAKHDRLSTLPTNADLLAAANPEERSRLLPLLRMKPTRTLSGVAIVTIQASPVGCPHGTCTFCPGGPSNPTVVGGVPVGPSAQSYTGREPAAMRAIRNHFDPYDQTLSRLVELRATGHSVDKIDFIVQGGTFPARAGRYQEWFLARAFDALNAFPPNDDSAGLPPPFGADERILEHERGAVPAERGPRTTTPPSAPGEFDLAGAQERNEIASARMIGLTIETKPDWCKKPHLETMLRLGTTRVEIGIQTVHEDQLLRTRRGHTAGDSIEATALAKDAGLKVCYHIMPGLPGSSMAKDMETFRTVLRDAAWSPDMLKIYPVLVVPGTELWDAWSRGEYKPADEAYCVDLLAEAKRIVPPWVRIQRIDRDIPTTLVSAGVKKSNLRELVHAEMRRRGTRCRCVRCRETGRVPGKVEELRFSEISYPASGGVEHFLSWEDPARDALVAFARVREPSADGWRPEGEDAVFLRELRVLGREVALAAAPSQAETQHRGLGRALLSKTEELARTLGRGKVTVTAGVGVREYYRRHGYERDGPYMSKKAQGVG